MTVHELLNRATKTLHESKINTADLDALILLEYATAQDRSKLLAEPEQKLSDSISSHYQTLINRRSQHEPIAYIVGQKEFYGLDFKVTPYTLIPRPETEDMIELALYLNIEQNIYLDIEHPFKVLDVGTGCGCIAIALAKQRPKWQVTASDISNKALAIAKQNADHHQTKVKLIQSDLLTNLKGQFSLITANLPYVRSDITITPSAKFEPKVAIFGGEDGLDLYRQLFMQLLNHLTASGYVLTECMPGQQPEMIKLASRANLNLVRQERLICLFQQGH